MNNFFEFTRLYWPILSAGCVGVFSLGVIYANLQSNTRAIKKLFEFYDEMGKFKEKQIAINQISEKESSKIREEVDRRHDSNGRRFDEIMARIDDLFKLFSSRKSA